MILLAVEVDAVNVANIFTFRRASMTFNWAGPEVLMMASVTSPGDSENVEASALGRLTKPAQQQADPRNISKSSYNIISNRADLPFFTPIPAPTAASLRTSAGAGDTTETQDQSVQSKISAYASFWCWRSQHEACLSPIMIYRLYVQNF